MHGQHSNALFAPMDASTADALFNLGNQLDDEGRFDEAIDAYQKSASISEFGGADHSVLQWCWCENDSE